MKWKFALEFSFKRTDSAGYPLALLSGYQLVKAAGNSVFWSWKYCGKGLFFSPIARGTLALRLGGKENTEDMEMNMEA